ncbi:MAG: DNA/RNA non-specific endonuclease [Bacteroidota bacterium]|nr:DNA/RNA non-specific endonuclease [Bacteroidota bacterium]
MKKLFLLFFSLLLLFSLPDIIAQKGKKNIVHPELPKTRSQDFILHHTGYTLSYNKTYHVANWVAYELTAEETVPVVKRNNHFVPDPLLGEGSASNADYKDSGYDRGHLAPSADLCYSKQTMLESFYLSNITPQEPAFNRGIWEHLEEQVRQWAVDDKDVYVVTGTILTPGLPAIGRDRITVPRCFFKVILDYTEPDVKGIGFIIPNKGSDLPLQHYAVTIDSVEKVTGIDFFYQLPQPRQEMIESKVDIRKWRMK